MLLHYIDLSWRSFKRTPLVSTLMIIAIGVGIGITMTCLSVYHMMSMDPIPHKSDQLYSVQLQILDEDETWRSHDNLPYQLTYQDAKHLAKVDLPFLKAPMIKSGGIIHSDDGTMKPFGALMRLTNRDFFTIFDNTFIYGSPWTVQQQNDAVEVVVIAKSLNDKLFQGKNSVGKVFNLDDIPLQVVGVVQDWQSPIKYYDLNNGAFSEQEKIFAPFSLIEAYEIDTWGNTNGWKHEEVRTFQDKLYSEKVWVQFWVELPNQQAHTDYGNYLMAYMQAQQKTGRFNRKTLEFSLRDVNELMHYRRVVSRDNRILVTLSFMFLAVCLANILGLLLAKFLKRAAEVGVRRALGASKTQIFVQHIVEVSLLGLLGGLVGILIAQLGLWGVRQTYHYYNALATMDISMLLAAPSIAIISCILAGLYPAWLVCKTTPASHLKSQ